MFVNSAICNPPDDGGTDARGGVAEDASPIEASTSDDAPSGVDASPSEGGDSASSREGGNDGDFGSSDL